MNPGGETACRSFQGWLSSGCIFHQQLGVVVSGVVKTILETTFQDLSVNPKRLAHGTPLVKWVDEQGRV